MPSYTSDPSTTRVSDNGFTNRTRIVDAHASPARLPVAIAEVLELHIAGVGRGLRSG